MKLFVGVILVAIIIFATLLALNLIFLLEPFEVNENDYSNIPLVSTINGKELPNKPTLAEKSVTVIKTIDESGHQIYVFKDTRAPGTRAPIHMHPYGGFTCMLEGEMTLYMEGSEPSTVSKGGCYYMPENTIMSGVNSGDTDAIMLDSFEVPVGKEFWIVIEEGQTDLQDHNFDNNTLS
jgi:quercetin dioxygenase-like cupin family protein